MTLRLNGSNSGFTEVKAPATAGSNTITLPTSNGSANQFLMNSGTAGELEYSSMVETSTGVGIGTTSPGSFDSEANKLVVGTGTGDQGITIYSGSNSTDFGSIFFADGTSGGAEKRGQIRYQQSSEVMSFVTNTTERMRIDSSGNVLVGKTSTSSSVDGVHIAGSGTVFATRSSNYAGYFNRESDDGQVILIAQDDTPEGNISVSGTTVSYNGAHLSRWSQLEGNAERIEILRGSVLSNLDEMCEWAYEAQDAVLYTDEDELPEGVSVGDVKTPARDAGTEDNEQLNRMKVSDVEGDPNVAGVFQAWDDDDDIYTNDFYCAMTGDFVIRIAQGTTVARGDLLMSAGDGTAKPQDDDIVRSKTIAKVTSTTVSTTYSDGSYCVPCVLMAC